MTHKIHLDHQYRLVLAETVQQRLERLALECLPGMTVTATGVLGAIPVGRSRLGTNHRPTGA